MTNLSRIAEALEKLLEKEVPQHDPYLNEQRIADALERIANVLEFRMPWLGANVAVPTIPNPFYPNQGTTYGIGSNSGSAVGPIPTPPPESYPDYSTAFSCGGGLLDTKDIPF